MTDTILVTDFDFPDLEIERDVLEGRDIDLVATDAETADEVIEAAREVEADALLVQYAPIDRAVLELLDVAVVGRYGIGVDAVDLEAAADEDVVVVNVPDYCQSEVATHTIALLFACVRKTALYDRAIAEGTWDWTVGAPIERLPGKTLGFAAFGSIPRRIVERLSGFDLEFVAYDPHQSADELAECGVEKVSFDGLLERSDIVSVHAPLTAETRGLFDAAAFAAMDDDAIVLNTARGEIVDDKALATALEDGVLAAAGLDVLPNEPPEDSPLVDRDDVVCTPHVAWYSEESIVELREGVTRDVVRVLDGEAPENPVTGDASSG
ncbi:C-terminal binding protein [Natronococcus occultus]|uniref:Phosphoglycerate dehydrogenase-like oxidoreductase n=1 Tax=Natronococcus occultus SP4 TaxID=694430 RepID=L0K362_9EURY|nr:C-terminal binding protein [Natronococcus occultus]AGB38548.1 phosphoglycerate dehydrogenase-like oxidoreductase [Natronococcus occultus SP4]